MILLRSFVAIFVLVGSSLQGFPFRNTNLTWNARVNDLVGRLTLDEITLQMAKGGAGINGPAPAISRLGIAPYQWNSECLHGEVGQMATAYPQSIGFAASWSYDVVYRMAEAISEAVRANHNKAVNNHNYADRTGLSCFSPVLNIMRDPRWGRNQETYGEDPYLSGMFGIAFVKGLHGNHSRYIRANGGCKHFNVHGGPENIPSFRWNFNSKVSMRDWRTTFLPAFRYCVKAGAYSLMCSYNSINGVPACANKQLLTDILRKEWGFHGYVVSDMEAVENIKNAFHYRTNDVDTAAAALDAGLNLELAAPDYKKETLMSISEAVRRGKLSESVVRERVKPLFYARMRHGEFDPSNMNPYSSIGMSVIENQSHRNMAIEAAMKSFVLLKNDGTLPLKKQLYNRIAIIGPTADAAYILMGSYASSPNPKFITTPRRGLESLGRSVNFAVGCMNSTYCTNYDSSSIRSAVHNVEVVFVFVGLGTLIEGEGKDRPDIELPGHQMQLIQDAVYNSGSAKVILITLNAGPINIQWADQSPRISAIIAAFYPGQEAGVALKNVLTSSYHPQFGRLPFTWYRSVSQVPPMIDYSMARRTYRYFKKDPLYPFGYGLTYTKFNFENLIVPGSVTAGQDLHVSVIVRNTGNLPGDESVQVYISWAQSSTPAPQLQLVSFVRVRLNTNGQTTVKFTIRADQMALWVDNIGWKVEEGRINIYVGGQQPNQKKSVGSNILNSHVDIHGNKLLGYF